MVFFAQSYLFLTSTLEEYLKPFEGNETVRDYVYNALHGLWLDMLIWPLLLLVVLVISTLGAKKS